MGATTYCDKHDLTNCAECTGAGAQHEASLKEPTHWQVQMRADLPSLPYIPGGPTMYSKFPGHCVSCGRRYEKDSAIHYSRDLDGWVALYCCVDKL